MDSTPIIFLAFANDRQTPSQYLRNLSKELDGIRTALRPLEKDGICELVVRTNATLQQIVDVFQDSVYRNRIAIFHYSGHADSYQLLLENIEGIPTLINSSGFNHFLGTSESLKLVFLNACSTVFQAKDLIQAGMPLVIATSKAVSDKVASGLAVSFYKSLAEGMDIGKSWDAVEHKFLAEGRDSHYRGIGSLVKDDTQVPDQLPWAMHVRPGSHPTLQESLPGMANNPLFGLPQISESYYLKLPKKPFINLQHFRKKDAAIFFGRGQDIRDLYLRIKSIHPIILFYGQSGVGKSSLLEAGLLPRLEADYQVSYVRRDHTLGLLGTLTTHMASLSAESEPSLLAQWLHIEKTASKPFILILDQVEEAFTKTSHCNSEKELSELLSELGAIFDLPQKKPQGKIILAYRKEYVPEVRKQVEKQALPYTELYLERLSRAGIIEAITGVSKNPITQSKYGISIQNDHEVNLPGIIADDLLEDQSGALAPVLQILLSRMWQESRDQYLSRSLYQQLKREGILLQNFFDRQMKQLENWNTEAVNSGLVLAILNEHTTILGTAASLPSADLWEKYRHQAEILPVIIQRSKDLYLLSQTSANETSLSHDTLAPLVQKAHKESDKLGQRALRILESKNLNGQFAETSILEESDLATVEEGEMGMRTRNKAEDLLIKKSQDRRKRQRRQKRLIRNLAVSAAVIILVFGVLATIFWQESIQNRKEARVLYLVSVSKEQFEENPVRALRIAEAAYAADSSSPQAIVSQQLAQVFYNSIYQKKPFPTASFQHEDFVSGAIFSADGNSILTHSRDGTAKLWDLSGQLLADLKHEKSVYGAIFSADGNSILTHSEDGTAKLWDLSGQLLADLKHEKSVSGAIFAADGNSILTHSVDRTAKLWDLSGQLLADLKHESWVSGAIFSADGNSILTHSVDRTAKLWDLSGQLLADLKHEKSVSGAIFSADGNSILTHSVDGTAKLWDLSGQLLADLRHEKSVHGAIFSADGNSILTRSEDGTAKLWDLSGQLLADLKHESWVSGAIFSADGNSILTRSSDGTAKLWDLSGQLLADLKHEKSVSGAIFSADGNSILTHSSDGTAKLWDLSGQLLADLKHEKRVSGAIFSADGNSILTHSVDGTAKLWDLSGQLLADLKHEKRVSGAIFSADGNSILTRSDDRTAKLWDLSGQLLADLKHEKSVSGAIFSADGNSILTHSEDGTAKLWDLSGQLLADLKHESIVSRAIFSADGNSILTHSSDGTAKLWDLSGQLLADLKHEDWVSGAIFSADGNSILTHSYDGTAKLWDLSGQLLADLKHESIVSGAVFSADGNSILTRSYDRTAKLWDLSGQLLADLKHEKRVSGAIFSADGNSILTHSEDGTAKLWDLSGQLLADLKHESIVSGAIFSADGNSILTHSVDGTAKLWDLSGQLLADLKHEKRVSGAIFSADGNSILTHSYDGTAKLWDLSGQLLADLKHEKSVYGAIFSADGNNILTYSYDGTGKLWDLSGQLLADLKHESWVSGAIFSADGNSILTHSYDGTAKLWDLSGQLLA
ncbi:MAG: CHAT domain-containing protein, partial [Cyanothece sp. SIO1E1]|nr:CHAT domain-containing protein [Cyanothece sp. SIO1E1]